MQRDVAEDFDGGAPYLDGQGHTFEGEAGSRSRRNGRGHDADRCHRRCAARGHAPAFRTGEHADVIVDRWGVVKDTVEGDAGQRS